jgi:hypothetical protein
METWHIEKIGEGRYEVCSREISTAVNGAQLSAMLNGRGLSNGAILDFLVSIALQRVGYQTEIAFRQMPTA